MQRVIQNVFGVVFAFVFCAMFYLFTSKMCIRDSNYSASARSEITVPWETAVASTDAEAVKERNLERIIVQKWIAIFPRCV